MGQKVKMILNCKKLKAYNSTMKQDVKHVT